MHFERRNLSIKGIQPRPSVGIGYAEVGVGPVLRVYPGIIAPLDSALHSQSIWRCGYGATLNSMGHFSEDVNGTTPGVRSSCRVRGVSWIFIAILCVLATARPTAAQWTAAEPIATGWVESTVDEIIARRMVKKALEPVHHSAVSYLASSCTECHPGTSLQHLARGVTLVVHNDAKKGPQGVH